MAQYRVSPPPSLTTERLWIRAIATAALFVALGGDAIRNTLGLTGFIVVAAALGIASAAFLFRQLRQSGLRGPWPWSLAAFILYAIASLAWSSWPGATVITLLGMLLCTVLGLFLALVTSWTELVSALSLALKALLGLSILFELFVSVVLRRPVLPVFPLTGEAFPAKPPLLMYWSRNELFGGDRIQGIVGNANLLGALALLGIIVFSLQLAQRRVMPASLQVREGGRGWGIFWLALAVLLFALSRSSTMILALGAVIVVAAAVLLIRRAAPGPARTRVYLWVGGIVVIGGGAALALRDTVFGLLGKGSDLTGRSEIWDIVAGVARRSPVVGNGYASPWIPAFEPFDSLVVRHGVVQLQAHNAWLDIWMQLGVIGVVLLGAVCVSTLWRTWFMAVDRPRVDLDASRPYTPLAMLPLLLLIVLLVQSAAESRPLIEWGWVLIVLLAVASKRRPLMDAFGPLAPEAAAAARYTRTERGE